MRVVLHTIARIGEWEIKERVRNGDTSMSKYAVYHRDGRHMEDFRRESSARKWCRETKPPSSKHGKRLSRIPK